MELRNGGIAGSDSWSCYRSVGVSDTTPISKSALKTLREPLQSLPRSEKLVGVHWVKARAAFAK